MEKPKGMGVLIAIANKAQKLKEADESKPEVKSKISSKLVEDDDKKTVAREILDAIKADDESAFDSALSSYFKICMNDDCEDSDEEEEIIDE